MKLGGVGYTSIHMIRSAVHVAFVEMFSSQGPALKRMALSTIWSTGFPIMYMILTIIE